MMRNLIRISLTGLLIIPILVFYKEFYLHFRGYLTGNIITMVLTRQWHIVLLSILLFLAFLIPLSYRRKATWAEYGLVTAFFVSLFFEMYGIPLTIFLTSRFFFPMRLPHNLIKFDLFGTSFGMTIAMVYAAAVIGIGMGLIITGWVTLYSHREKKIVTYGIYRFCRHPQYLGFILIVLGWFIGWPSPLTLVFSPILIYKYIRVCKKEEKELSLDTAYIRYAERVPLLI
ncbi:MAG: hypothetical protein A2V65_11560 [Deltaproteobacteria bacterium RBG_13_49_15]|nr:MAG: hypothetical protein A2V65_11560 [Deltaproteobacteria bacterium RBG_13_49_15]